MKKITNLYERILSIAIENDYKNINDFAINGLKYKASEKLNRLKKEGNKPSNDILIDISNKFENVDLHWLLTGKKRQTENKNSLLDARPIIEINPESKSNTIIADVNASAGFGSFLNNPKKMEQLPSISLPNAPYGLNVAFQTTGDSMHATIRHLDYIAANQLHSFDDIRDGNVYVVIDKDDGALCKRLYRQGNDIQIVSDNPSYRTYSRTRNDLLGVFKAFCRLSFDFRTYHNDMRNDIQDLREKISSLNTRMEALESSGN